LNKLQPLRNLAYTSDKFYKKNLLLIVFETWPKYQNAPNFILTEVSIELLIYKISSSKYKGIYGEVE